jgi:hypothetical protein
MYHHIYFWLYSGPALFIIVSDIVPFHFTTIYSVSCQPFQHDLFCPRFRPSLVPALVAAADRPRLLSFLLFHLTHTCSFPSAFARLVVLSSDYMSECSSSRTGFTLGTEEEISSSDRSNVGWEQLPRKPTRVSPPPVGIKWSIPIRTDKQKCIQLALVHQWAPSRIDESRSEAGFIDNLKAQDIRLFEKDWNWNR